MGFTVTPDYESHLADDTRGREGGGGGTEITPFGARAGVCPLKAFNFNGMPRPPPPRFRDIRGFVPSRRVLRPITSPALLGPPRASGERKKRERYG